MNSNKVESCDWIKDQIFVMVFNLLIGGETNAAAAILAVLRGGRRNRRAATLLGQSDRTLA